MTCEILLTATLEGISKFMDGEKSGCYENESDSSRKKLQNFKIAISPTGEIIVFAKSTWLLVCSSKWDSSVTDGTKVKYSPYWQGHVNCKTGEEITSIFLLPFFSQGQSSVGGSDWTCIILGFSSGCIRFYTEGMQELACSILQEEKISDIKCFAAITVSQGKQQTQENADIYILYKTVICILNKSQLSQILQNKRNELAKGFSFSKNEIKGYLSVDFKKYSFTGQEEVVDACFLGQSLVSSFNTFDHLVTASLVGGFNSNYRASPPQTSLIVTAGRRPFVGFHYTLEGANSPVLSDVALAVASKIKNSVTATLPDWFNFGSKKSTESDKPKEVSQDYAEKLNCRFGLCDLWRQGQSIIVSPDGIFSAITDSLGRVILVENTSGIAHRLWKGYRDAQCGFIQVYEDRKLKKMKENICKVQPRHGLFLIIYAPKKGLIEVFTTQHGQRVTSFKVTKRGCLLYNPGAAGSSNISSGGFNLCQTQVIFISEEGLNEFSVPFHCALTEENSKISRDLVVLKKMKVLLKMESNSSTSKVLEDIENCARELKTDEVRLQAIESMISYKNVTLEAFMSVLMVFLEALQSKERGKPAPEKITAFAETVLNLLQFYKFLINFESLKTNPDSEFEKTDQNSFFEELRLPQNELDVVLKFIQQVTQIEAIRSQTIKVAFEDKKSTKLAQYLSCFDFESFLSILDKNEKQQENVESHAGVLNLKSNERERSFCYLGEIFFKSVFKLFSVFEQWKNYIEKCCFNPQDLTFCLISYWCKQKIVDDLLPEVHIFIEVLKLFCSLSDPYIVVAESNTESPWWKELRNFISGNPFTIRGLFAALCCRSVNIFMEREREFALKHSSEKKFAIKATEVSSAIEATNFSNDWETISKDSCQWDILITQLQDVALLNAILNLTFKTQSNFPQILFDFEPQSLSSIQANGTGRVSELVAKWLIQFGLGPSALIDTNDIEFQISGDGKEIQKQGSDLIFAIDKANETRNSKEILNPALEYLALLKSRYPYSLTSSSLLGNIYWEYLANWFKNIGDIQYLESAVQYLEGIPTCRVKYGISHLSWKTYLEQKFETLATMINRIGKVPRDKLCVQEIGLRNNQVPIFFKLTSRILRIMLHTEEDEKPDFSTNREAIWQNSSTIESSLVNIALSRPVANSDLILFQLQLSLSLFMMTSLNVKYQKVFSSLFDNVERSSFTSASGTPHLSCHYQNLKLKDSRTEFLKKCLTAAVQTVEITEYIPPPNLGKISDIVPTTRLKTESYQKWLQLCFELAGMWAIPLDDLRKHQICELYSCGFDRLAEEVISSVSDTDVLGSQLLVLGGKRLKYLIQDSENLSKKMTKLSSNLSEWLHTLDLENFSYHGTVDDVEVLMRYTATLLPEGHSNQKLAVSVIESLSFFKTRNSL